MSRNSKRRVPVRESSLEETRKGRSLYGGSETQANRRRENRLDARTDEHMMTQKPDTRSLQDLRNIIKRHCKVCGKEKEVFYGNWYDGGSCGRACEDVLAKERSDYFKSMLDGQQSCNS